MSERKAEEKLSGTLSAEKNELLFTEFDINYNHIDMIFKKGTVLVWTQVVDPLKLQKF